jgi:ribosome biogenesis GTPase / thiamine phosphate phosphatase
MTILIDHYGWSGDFAGAFEPYAALGCSPGRIVAQHRGAYATISPAGELRARLSGHLLHAAPEGDFPAVGDWVALRPPERGGPATIQAVLPRRTAFVRKAADSVRTPQVVAANIDLALLVTALTGDFNPRRLERYLAAAWQSGARPLVVLTKADLEGDPARRRGDAEAVAIGCETIAVSAVTGDGLAELAERLKPRETCVLLGSSGAGKSTLVNALAGETLMGTAAVSTHDGRGRHTTTHRELIRLPSGALLLDTPGMRELGLLDADTGLVTAFEDIEALAANCRFHDCRHAGEPGCAVRAALDDGALDVGRWRNFDKLRRELAHVERKEDPLARAAERKRWIAIHKGGRARKKLKDRWEPGLHSIPA